MTRRDARDVIKIRDTLGVLNFALKASPAPTPPTEELIILLAR